MSKTCCKKYIILPIKLVWRKKWVWHQVLQLMLTPTNPRMRYSWSVLCMSVINHASCWNMMINFLHSHRQDLQQIEYLYIQPSQPMVWILTILKHSSWCVEIHARQQEMHMTVLGWMDIWIPVGYVVITIKFFQQYILSKVFLAQFLRDWPKGQPFHKLKVYFKVLRSNHQPSKHLWQL